MGRHRDGDLSESGNYAGEILLVGVNYDKENPDKPHSCVIERMEKQS